MRVGSPKLDNYHSVGGNSGQFTRALAISLEDTPEAIKQRLWSETDRVYRAAVQRLLQIQTNRDVSVAASGNVGRLFRRASNEVLRDRSAAEVRR